MSEVFIYGLIDPRTDEIRYVGQTVNPANRFSAHLRGLKETSQKAEWVRELLDAGFCPVMKILEVCPMEKRNSREVDWIVKLRTDGFNLTNATPSVEDCRQIDEQRRWQEYHATLQRIAELEGKKLALEWLLEQRVGKFRNLDDLADRICEENNELLKKVEAVEAEVEEWRTGKRLYVNSVEMPR